MSRLEGEVGKEKGLPEEIVRVEIGKINPDSPATDRTCQVNQQQQTVEDGDLTGSKNKLKVRKKANLKR